MSYIYAQLDENNVCVAVSQLAGEAVGENMVRVDSLDDDYLGRKYEDGEWGEKIEPEIPDSPDIPPLPTGKYTAQEKNDFLEGMMEDFDYE